MNTLKDIFRYDHDIKLPFVPGFEVCGEVLELGSDVNSVSVGQRIVGLNKEKMGGFAEECVLDQSVSISTFYLLC